MAKSTEQLAEKPFNDLPFLPPSQDSLSLSMSYVNWWPRQYLHIYDDAVQLYEGLSGYFDFYNETRPHQGLAYETPGTIYAAA